MASDAQVNQRRNFVRACACFAKQPPTGGATPPATGPRGRDWWFNAAAGSGKFYYNYFMQQTLAALIANNSAPWCIESAPPFNWCMICNKFPTENITNPFDITTTRGINSHSGVWTGNEDSIVYLGIVQIDCGDMFPLNIHCTGGGYGLPRHMYVYTYPGAPDISTLNWDNAYKEMSGPTAVTFPANGGWGDINLNGFSRVNGKCTILIGETVPPSTPGSTIQGYSAETTLQY